MTANKYNPSPLAIVESGKLHKTITKLEIKLLVSSRFSFIRKTDSTIIRTIITGSERYNIV